MKIIISHVYSFDNKGDAALLGVLIDECRRQFKQPEITIMTLDPAGDASLFPSTTLMASLMYYAKNRFSNKLPQLVYGMFMASYTLFWTSLWRATHVRLPLPGKWRAPIGVYLECDLIIPVGGGYLRTKPETASLFDFVLLLHPLMLARSLRKPTVLYSQSIGPVYQASSRRLLTAVLNRCVSLAIIRENTSLELLQKIGIKRLVRSVDAGFLLESDSSIKPVIKRRAGKLMVGVTARRWLDSASQSRYEREMAKTLDALIVTDNAFIVLIPQVTSELLDDDDRIVSRSIAKKMKQKGNVLVLEENYDYRQIKTIYDGLDLLLGTRFHSVIFSLTSYVPAMAIEYEHKTSGIMNDLDLAEWVIKMEDVKAPILIKKMRELINVRENYTKKLKKVVPAYKLQAHNAIEYVSEAYDRTLVPDDDM